MCSQTCGIVAALCSCLFHGTFVCPMKSKAANSVNVDPLVFQTYKVCMCFILSWLTLLVVEFIFTPWGLVSGLLWIPGGSAGIYAVRTNGIAISVGIWSCISVLTSTMWGFLVFDEKVKSDLFTMIGVIMLIIGVIGLSFSSAPDNNKNENDQDAKEDSLKAPLLERKDTSPTLDINDDIDIGWFESDFSDDSFMTVLEDNNNSSSQEEVTDSARNENKSDYVNVCGLEVSRFVLGVFCAILNGVNSGSVLVPMHYSGMKGLEFAPSFAIGALNALVLAWLARFLYHYFKTGYISTAFYTLPPMHLRKMLLPGIISGTLWQIGSIGGMLSVSFFGQGIGMSIGQSSLVVSGLWGIFFFKEVVRSVKIASWFASAIITIAGVYVLCREHKDG